MAESCTLSETTRRDATVKLEQNPFTIIPSGKIIMHAKGKSRTHKPARLYVHDQGMPV